jgi:hypothetical protein
MTLKELAPYIDSDSICLNIRNKDRHYLGATSLLKRELDTSEYCSEEVLSIRTSRSDHLLHIDLMVSDDHDRSGLITHN